MSVIYARNKAGKLVPVKLTQGPAITPLFANSIDECVDTTKLYVLPDGFIYAYTDGGGEGATPNFENLADENSADWQNDKRWNSSHVLTDAPGVDITNYIPVNNVSVLHLKGLDILSNIGGANYGRVYGYDANKNYLGYGQPSTKTELFTQAGYDSSVCLVNITGCVNYWAPFQDGALQYVQLGGIPTGEVIITADEEITYTSGGSAWRNTGHAFVPADYEDRIIELEKTAEEHSEKLAELSGGAEKEVIPEYWAEAVEAAVAKVKARQDEGGPDIVNFVWFSDLHYAPGDAYTKNVGALCAKMMDECNIPLTLMSGDTMSAAVVNSEATLLSYLDGAEKLLFPIGADRIMRIRGNHDDVWGSGNGNSYVNKADPGKVWNRISRGQAMNNNHVFGGLSYFYVDNREQKIRFVCLDTHFYDGPAITDGTVKNMTFAFGSKQLDWLEQTALVVEDGWKIIVCSHVPPTDYYLGEISDGATFKDILTAAADKILAVFSGHVHRDAIYTGVYSFPIITITCAVNSTYDNTEDTRTAGTITETAIDVVSVNKATGNIKTVRLGIGSDRSLQ